jgi:hypothetical protein
VFPDSEPGAGNTGQLYAAGNEYESIQLVLRAKHDIPRLTVEYVESGDAPIPEAWVELFEALYLETPGVAKWGIPPKFPESRRDTYPDPLAPLLGGNRDGTIALKGGETRAVWMRVHVPDASAAGEYSGKLAVVWDGGRIEAPVELKVWPFTLPRASSLRTAIGLTERDIAKFHNVAHGSDQSRELMKRYYDELLKHRINAYYLPYSVTDPRARDYLHDERVSSFIVSMNKTVWQHLKDEGVLHKAWVYNVDEPRDQGTYEVIKDQTRVLRSDMPGLRYGVPFYAGPNWDNSITPMDELTGYMDLWICQTDYYAHGHGLGTKVQNQMRERFESGDETWYYVAHAPREPFCGFHLNFSALQHRILLWQAYADPIITGLLYWRATHWWEVEDPYQDMATVKGIDPHIWGDGSLFYPGTRFGIDGPVTSIRLECIRDGLEDLEYLVLAEKKFGRERVMELVRQVTHDLQNFTRDPEVFESIRLRIGIMLATAE